MESKSQELVADFANYCFKHPELRFWQGLRAWSEASAILVDWGNHDVHDTFYWEGKDK